MAIDISVPLNKLIADIKAQAADGLTFTEGKAALLNFTGAAMQLVAAEFVGPGADKKTVVLFWVQRAIDELYPLVDFLPLPWWLAWAKPLLAKFVKQQLLAEVSALIDVLYARFLKPGVV